MKIYLLNRKSFRLRLTLVIGLLSICGLVNSQTSTWNGSSWSTVAPSDTTFHYTFNVNGSGCAIGNANMATLNVNPNGICTISGTVNSTNVNLPLDNISELIVGGTLNVNSITLLSLLSGTGTVNLSAGSYSQSNGVNYGICNVNNFNVLTGAIVFPFYFSFGNLTIAQGANVSITYSNSYFPRVTGTLTVNGTLTNNYTYYDNVIRTYSYLEIANLLINSTGSYNSSAGYSRISQSFKIGGSITHAGSINSYSYDFITPSTTRVLEIFGNANVAFTDLSNSNISNQYIGTLNVYSGGKFTVDKSLTVNTVTINTQGSIISSGSPTITATAIGSIEGRLILPGVTLNNSQTSLTINGTNSAIAYLNKPALRITLTGTTDTLRNCSLERVTVNAGAKGYVNNTSSYKIQRIDAADLVTIASLPKNDTIKIAATGSVVLTGNTRVSKLVDITALGSLTSNGNLTMLDQSSLVFATNGQITGNINWHRKYGSAGWVYFGSPFTGTNRTSILGTISPGYVNINDYVESQSAKRWVPKGSEDFVPGQGYELGITTISPANNDTVVFTGNPTRTDVDVNGLTYTTTNGTWLDYQRGYNLVANPYTAPINVAGFFTDNPNLSAIYYWDDIGKGKGVFVARSSSGLITPLASVSDKNKTKVQASYLSPNQGFFVKIPSDGLTTTAHFKESRITSDLNDNFLKSAAANYIRLQVENASGTKNDCIIQFSVAANDTFTPNLDVYKLTSTTYPLEIYSFKKTEEFAIQSRKPITGDLYIPLGLLVQKNEKHTFHIDNFDALPAVINPYIWDKVAQRSVNLRDSSFSVALSAGTIDNRFELVFKTGLLATGTNSLSQVSDFNMYSQDGHVYINFSQMQQNTTVEVSDISGRIIQHQFLPEAEGRVEIKGNYKPNNIYIFKISGRDISTINKLLIQ